MSFLPDVVAFREWKAAFVVFAITLAIVVFPVPGGPKKITDESLSA